MKTHINVIDLFSGCGGLSYGFCQATHAERDFRVLGGVDLDVHANQTYEAMIGAPARAMDVAALTDVRKLTSFLKSLGCSPRDPLVVIGGPPCQGFSAHRKKDSRKDDRNSLVNSFFEVAVACRPEFIVMENVPEIFDAKHWKHFEKAKEYLEEHGYRVRATIHNLSDYGVPQSRFRAVVIARRAGRPFSMLPPPRVRRLVTVREAIGALPPIRSGEVDPNDAMHRAPKHEQRILRLIASVPKDGGSRRDAQQELLPRCHGTVDGFRDVYGRLSWDKTSISITAKCSTPSCGRFLHPEQDRNLSVREAALLQGFPKDFLFSGPLIQQYRQIGNAVSPLFAHLIAEHVLAEFGKAAVVDDPLDDVSSPLTKSFASGIAFRKRRAEESNGRSDHRRDGVDSCNGYSGNSLLPAIDCFCGAGGLSLGLHRSGFRPVFAFDNWKYAVDTYRNNIASCVEMVSAEEVKAEDVLRRCGLSPGDCMLVAGGPPCQGFSQQRRGQDDDPRNSLVLWYADFLERVKPVFFILENVTYLAAKRGRKVFEEFRLRMQSAGYRLYDAELNAADYGVPQLRSRVFVVGHVDTSGLSFDFPLPTVECRATVRDAIGDLPSPPADVNAEHPDYANHRRANITKINEIRISHVPPGGGWKDIPDELQLRCHKDHRGQGHIDVFGRLSWDSQARTITALCDSFTRGQFAHPVEDRPISGREAAAIQSFPNSFRFEGPKKDVARQVGNAVPPLMAEAIGLAIRSSIERWIHRGGKKDAARRLIAV